MLMTNELVIPFAFDDSFMSKCSWNQKKSFDEWANDL
jgi:hypothetical protein